jgi:hypothetical protein
MFYIDKIVNSGILCVWYYFYDYYLCYLINNKRLYFIILTQSKFRLVVGDCSSEFRQ